jgi:hypothetical protein
VFEGLDVDVDSSKPGVLAALLDEDVDENGEE